MQEFNEKKDLSYLIDKIVSSDSFREANYNIRSMKKLPHGGVAYIYYTILYLKHYPADTFWLFSNESNNIPCFLSRLVEYAYQEYLKCDIGVEELCWLCFDDYDFWYAGFRLLEPKKRNMKKIF